MGDTLITRLAGFAAGLDLNEVPATVGERVRLQHLSAAGVLRAVSGTAFAGQLDATTGRRGRAVKATGGTCSAADAARVNSALVSAWGWDDLVFMAPTSAGGVSAAWAHAKGRSVDDLIRATVAANEVAGRLGAALILSRDPLDAFGEVHALAAATAAGLLEGLNEAQLAHAMAISVSACSRTPFGVLAGDGPARGLAVAQSVSRGLEAVTMAKKGMTGPLDALDAADGLLSSGSLIPLRAGFSGLGDAWLSQTLVYKSMPGPIAWQSALQALNEVLARHVKAAGKRLRADQVDRIEISLPGPALALAERAAGRPVSSPWGVPWRLNAAIGVLVADHTLGGRTHDPEVWSAMQERVRQVASKVVVQHDWDLTKQMVQHTLDIWAPLLAGVTASELQEALRMGKGVHGVPARPGGAGVLALLRMRPGKWLEQMRYSSGNLSDVHVDEWQYRLGARVRVGTTRGGSWPEVREIPECSPGWSWEQTRTGVFTKLVGDGGDGEVAATLCAVPGERPADEWVGELLTPA